MNYLSSIQVATLATNGNSIYASVTGHSYLSTNNGSSWTLFYAIPILSYAFNGINTFAGTMNGVELSSDNGTSWTTIDSGLPISSIFRSLAINANNVFVGSDSGIFLTTNNGMNWTNVNTGLTINTSINSLVVNGNYIFAGLNGYGVWKRPLSDFTSDIKENTINNNISIYPNPTKDNLTIETNSNTEQRLEILNLIGQTVYTNIINKKATINTSDFANGVYILKLSSDKETVVKKFVKE